MKRDWLDASTRARLLAFAIALTAGMGPCVAWGAGPSTEPGPTAGTPGATAPAPASPAASPAWKSDAKVAAPPRTEWAYGVPKESAKRTVDSATGNSIKARADKTGRISREQFLQFMGARFDAADKQGKGSLSVQEAERLAK